MRTTKVQGTLRVLIFAAAVALFLGVPAVSKSDLAVGPAGSMNSNGAETLIADGGDPQPKPVPLPWLGRVS
jgi:hypothetical protein